MGGAKQRPGLNNFKVNYTQFTEIQKKKKKFIILVQQFYVTGKKNRLFLKNSGNSVKSLNSQSGNFKCAAD